MSLNEKEIEIYNDSSKVLEVLYDYFKFEINTLKETAENEVSKALLDKLTNTIKETIRYNNKLTKAIEEKTIALDSNTINSLNLFYSYYEQLPKKESEVTSSSGQALMEIYTGMVKHMTPVSLFIVTYLEEKAKS